MDTRWRIELFGGLRVQRGEQVLTRFRTQKTALLLGYLAYYRQRTHPREALIEMLWPESDLDSARHKLNVALSAIRDQLEPEGQSRRGVGAHSATVLVTDRSSVRFDPAAVVTDVAEFEAALNAAGSTAHPTEQIALLVQAVELYRGPLLPGHYEEWVLREQQRWEELFFQSLRQLIALLERSGEAERALPYALRAVSADPLNEEAHREVMRLFAALNQPAAALRQYQELQRLLQQELDDTPSDATRQLAEEVQRGSVQAFRRSGVQADRDASRQSKDAQPALPERAGPPLRGGAPRTPERLTLEPVRGAVPLGSPFYVFRPADQQFQAAIARQDSIVLVKGPRQVGKTSLLGRGLEQARQAGAQVVHTDLQTLNAAHLESAETLLLALGESLGEQLDLEVMPADIWESRRGPSPNFRRFLRREVLSRTTAPLVWGLDEVDRLFHCDFASEIFGLFRSWHNERVLDPTGPMAQLALAMAYATEAHLFITDVNQSPFNVGTRATLEDFTRDQVADLNARYGSPLQAEAELARLYRLVGGHPYLVRCALDALATHETDLAGLEACATSGGSFFEDHLRRLRALLLRDPSLCEAVRAVLRGEPCPTPESFYRLRSAGVLTGRAEAEARPRCQLYWTYLEQCLL